MEQYINKAAVVAEIEKRIASLESIGTEDYLHDIFPKQYAMLVTLKSLKLSIDTLETKEVEEPTAADKGVAEEIIVNLKRIEQDYLIDLTKEMEWVRSKVKKGE